MDAWGADHLGMFHLAPRLQTPARVLEQPLIHTLGYGRPTGRMSDTGKKRPVPSRPTHLSPRWKWPQLVRA